HRHGWHEQPASGGVGRAAAVVFRWRARCGCVSNFAGETPSTIGNRAPADRRARSGCVHAGVLRSDRTRQALPRLRSGSGVALYAVSDAGLPGSVFLFELCAAEELAPTCRASWFSIGMRVCRLAGAHRGSVGVRRIPRAKSALEDLLPGQQKCSTVQSAGRAANLQSRRRRAIAKKTRIPGGEAAEPLQRTITRAK